MTEKLVVFTNRTNIVPVNVGMDVSGDEISSQIRAYDGTLIATWQIEFDNDGTDGQLIFTLDNSVLTSVPYQTGLMDIKRVSNGEPYPIGDQAIEVEFRETITT